MLQWSRHSSRRIQWQTSGKHPIAQDSFSGDLSFPSLCLSSFVALSHPFFCDSARQLEIMLVSPHSPQNTWRPCPSGPSFSSRCYSFLRQSLPLAPYIQKQPIDSGDPKPQETWPDNLLREWPYCSHTWHAVESDKPSVVFRTDVTWKRCAFSGSFVTLCLLFFYKNVTNLGNIQYLYLHFFSVE